MKGVFEAENTAESTVEIFIETLRRVESEIESAIETLEILSDKETLESIEEGLQDIKRGNVIGFEDFLRKHGYEV
jgi:SPX domain protein involved in polyphosphate accumulation